MLRDAVGSFLVLTLAATAPAKARHRRASARLIARSIVAPPAVGAVLLMLVCAAELALAVLFCLDPAAVPVGVLGALLFAAFAVQHLVVRARSGSSSCGCAGPALSGTGRPGEAAGRCVAAVLLATLSLVWATSPARESPSTGWPPWAALATPLVALALGRLRTSSPMVQEKR